MVAEADICRMTSRGGRHLESVVTTLAAAMLFMLFSCHTAVEPSQTLCLTMSAKSSQTCRWNSIKYNFTCSTVFMQLQERHMLCFCN